VIVGKVGVTVGIGVPFLHPPKVIARQIKIRVEMINNTDGLRGILDDGRGEFIGCSPSYPID